MVDLEALSIQTRNRRREIDSLTGEARAVLTRGGEIQKESKQLAGEIDVLDKVTVILNSMGEDRQIKAQQQIEGLVTRGLQTIFDETLSFHIVQSVRGKSANVEFFVRTTLSDSVVETPVLEARGGGLAVTIGFLLRVVVMLLTRGTRQENIMILDETFSHVSDEYIPAVGEFLQELKNKTGIQFIMVTHQSQFADYADKVYRFTTIDGKTQAQEDA